MIIDVVAVVVVVVVAVVVVVVVVVIVVVVVVDRQARRTRTQSTYAHTQAAVCRGGSQLTGWVRFHHAQPPPLPLRGGLEHWAPTSLPYCGGTYS